MTTSFRDLLLIAGFGTFGTVARYTVSGWAYKVFGEGFAYGTFAVNIIGCFVLGLIMELGLSSDLIPRELRVGLSVGFLGAFTTFSTFGYETIRYLEDGAWKLAALNIAGNLVIGLMGCWLGISAAKLLMK